MILVKGLCFCRRPPSGAAGDDSDNPHMPALSEAQLVFRSNGMGGLGYTLPVNPDLSRCDLTGCQ